MDIYEEDRIILRNQFGEYVSVDRSSGGYPSKETSALKAHAFKGEKEALSYAAMFKHRPFYIQQRTYHIRVMVKLLDPK